MRTIHTISAIMFCLAGCGWTSAQTDFQIVDEAVVNHDNQRWHVIDNEAVFMVPADAASEVDWPMPSPNLPLSKILPLRSTGKPVTCRPVDFIDCTEETHNFRDDGESRILELPGGEFRVTASMKGFDLKWFAYDVSTAGRAGQPHLLVWEMPNDQERYTTVTLTVPKGEPWAPPYAGAEATEVDGFSISQEPLWYEPDVGLSFYTGRDLPLDNVPFNGHYIFFPKTAKMKVTVSSSGWANPVTETTGGAVSRIWVFEITDELADRLPEIDIPEKKSPRRLGLYTTHPWYYLGHYGVPPFTEAQRRESLTNLCDLLAFCGMNLIEFNAINGSDRAGATWYPSETGYYGHLGKDYGTSLVEELPPVAAERGIDVVPVVTSITAPTPVTGDEPNEYGFTEMSFQKHMNPKVDPRAFENRAPDPLRPETQAWLTRHVVEIAEQSKHHENVIGIGFRVNGKIGTCYISGEDKSGSGGPPVYSAAEMGYSEWNLQEFKKETGMDVPMDSTKAYHWLKGEPKRWDAWLDFRCRRTHEFWLRIRDAVKAVRKDYTLYVLTDLPSEVLETNVKWPGPDAPLDEAKQVTLDLLRSHGYDPRMYKNDEGILIQRVMMIDMERYWSKWGPPWGATPTNYRDYHEQEFLPKWYETPAGRGVELYHTYWEEPYHPDGEFGPNAEGFGMRTATASAKGRAFYRPMTWSLRAGDVDTMVLNGWERPVLGHEHDLRRFAQAMLALPRTSYTELKADPESVDIVARKYSDRICVINDAPEPQQIRVTLDKPIGSSMQLRDLASGEIVISADEKTRNVVVTMLRGYDIRTMVIEKASSR